MKPLGDDGWLERAGGYGRTIAALRRTRTIAAVDVFVKKIIFSF
jgi:hypothetical protein